MGTLLTPNTDAHWAPWGLLIFFILFLLFVASTYLRSQKKIHAHLSGLPLEKNDEGVSR